MTSDKSLSVGSQIAVMQAFGALVTVLGIVGLYIFVNSQWFALHDEPYPYGVWEGYTPTQFFGLCLFTFLTPIGITLQLVSCQHFLRRLSLHPRVAISILMICVFIIVGAVAEAYWGDVTMRCFVMGCVNTDTYPPEAANIPEAGRGWLTTVAIPVFFMGLFLSLSILWNLWDTYRSYGKSGMSSSKNGWSSDHLPLLRQREGAPFSSPQLSFAAAHKNLSPKPYRERLWWNWLCYFLLLPFFLIFAFTTTYVPNK